MSQVVEDILAKRRDRAIAIVLSVKERECDQYLPPEARSKLRKVVLDQLNDVVELAMDLVSSVEADQVNELWFEKLEEIHAAVKELA